MKLVASREALLGALAVAVPATESRGTLPILASVLLRPEANGSLLIVGSNLNCTVSARCDARAEGDGVAIPARDLLALVKSLPASAEVSIESTANFHVEVKAGKFRSSIIGLPTKDFPRLPAAPDLVEIDAAPLRAAFEATVFAASTDPSRPQQVQSVRVLRVGGGSVVISAADNNRASRYVIAMQNFPFEEAIIPRDFFGAILAVLESAGSGKVKLGVDKSMAFFEHGDVTVAAKQTPGPALDLDSVIPRSFDRVTSFDRERAIEAIGRVVSFAADRSNALRIRLDESGMLLTAENPDKGRASDEIECDPVSDTLTFGISGKVLSDALCHMHGERVLFKSIGPKDPLVFAATTGAEHLTIAMPMVID